MSVTLIQPATAMAPGLSMNLAASGGVSPYTFSVLPGGAGGSIDSTTGVYTAPSSMGTTPTTLIDTIRIIDSVSSVGQGTMLVGSPIFLLCDIIQSQMDLDPGRVYVWDQKINQPKDDSLYIAVSVMREKVFGNSKVYNASSGYLAGQSVNVMAGIGIDIISRGSDARDRKEEVVMAILSDYAEYQMAANSFSIGRLPLGGSFINLSFIDGSAIPYRFHLDLNLQYFVTKTSDVPFYDTISRTVITQP